MKKLKAHKLKLIILVALVATFGLFNITGINAASSAPTTFTANSEKLLEGYIDGWRYAKLTSSLGGYVYCRNYHLAIPYGVTMTLEGEAPAAIAYILSNGFPRTSITGNNDMDYYITQAALWWYMDLHMGTNNLPEPVKTTGSDPHNLRPYIKKLVQGAESVSSYATPTMSLVNNDSSLHLSSDKKYYESNTISVKAQYTTGNYTISLQSAPSGTMIVNASNGVSQSSFATNESFKIKIPVNSVDVGNLNIKVTATATGSINKAYMYKSSDPTKQSVFGSVLYPETSTLKDETTLTLSTSKVTITKIDDDTNKPLAGAKFVVKDSAGTTVASWTSTTSSHVIKNLPNGTYTLQEVEAPKGYILNDQVIKFTITDTNRNISIRFNNDAINKEATIIKVDAKTNKPIAGAVLVVKDSTGKVVEQFTTTTTNHVLKNLADGTYTVEEKEAPKGYKKTDEIFKFTISDTNNKATITIKNELIEKTAEIIKIDSVTKNPVAGAVLVVKDSTGKVIEEFTTTTKPHILEDLADGTYTVEEKEAPKGYEKTDEIYSFTISDTNNKASITIENKAIDKLVSILKVDAKTGNPLSGATLVVKDSTGKVIEEFITTEEAHIITDLADGTYTVEEKAAPEGYTKSDEVYTFTISDDKPSALVIFENNEIVEVPFTGSNKSLISTIFGSMLLISGVGFVYYNGKKQKIKH